VTREEAIALACASIKAKPQSYYAEPFEPHEWVVAAILAAAAVTEVELRAEVIDTRAQLRREQDARAALRIEINRARRAMVQIQSIVRSHFPGGLPATVAKQVLYLAFFEEPDGPATPLDDLAENLVADLHQLASGPGTTTEDRRLEILFSKAHALALVLADTRRRLLAMEAAGG
jgi:hypothetical protein